MSKVTLMRIMENVLFPASSRYACISYVEDRNAHLCNNSISIFSCFSDGERLKPEQVTAFLATFLCQRIYWQVSGLKETSNSPHKRRTFVKGIDNPSHHGDVNDILLWGGTKTSLGELYLEQLNRIQQIISVSSYYLCIQGKISDILIKQMTLEKLKESVSGEDYIKVENQLKNRLADAFEQSLEIKRWMRLTSKITSDNVVHILTAGVLLATYDNAYIRYPDNNRKEMIIENVYSLFSEGEERQEVAGDEAAEKYFKEKLKDKNLVCVLGANKEFVTRFNKETFDGNHVEPVLIPDNLLLNGMAIEIMLKAELIVALPDIWCDNLAQLDKLLTFISAKKFICLYQNGSDKLLPFEKIIQRELLILQCDEGKKVATIKGLTRLMSDESNIKITFEEMFEFCHDVIASVSYVECYNATKKIEGIFDEIERKNKKEILLCCSMNVSSSTLSEALSGRAFNKVVFGTLAPVDKYITEIFYIIK